MKLKAAGKTDVGLVRDNNEDSFYINEDLGIFIVCDGIGGELGGEVASATAVKETVAYLEKEKDYFLKCQQGDIKDEDIFQFFAEAIRYACKKIYKLSLKSSEYKNMGSTLTMAVNMGSRVLICNVGDSRAYLLNDRGVHQITEDHTLFMDLYKKGLVKDDIEPDNYMHRTLTRSLGTISSVEVDCVMVSMAGEDKIFLCTDGVGNYLEDEDDVIDLLSDKNLEVNVSELIQFALNNKGEDNATAIVLGISKEDEEGDEDYLQENLIMEILNSCQIYEGLSYTELAALRSFKEVVSLNKDEVLVQACERYSGFFIVMDGGILSRDELLIRGDSIGLKSLVKEHYCPDDKVAVRNTRLLFLSHRRFEALCVKYPRIANAILKNIIKLL